MKANSQMSEQTKHAFVGTALVPTKLYGHHHEVQGQVVLLITSPLDLYGTSVGVPAGVINKSLWFLYICTFQSMPNCVCLRRKFSDPTFRSFMKQFLFFLKLVEANLQMSEQINTPCS